MTKECGCEIKKKIKIKKCNKNQHIHLIDKFNVLDKNNCGCNKNNCKCNKNNCKCNKNNCNCNKKIIGVTTIYDSKPPGVNGGTFMAGNWITRTLNTINGNNGVILNNNNSFTLAPGNYIINVSAPAYNVNSHQARLFNVNNNVTSKFGSSEFTVSNSTNSLINYSTGILQFPTTFRIEHRAQLSQVVFGLGVSANFSDQEIYTQVEIIHLI